MSSPDPKPSAALQVNGVEETGSALRNQSWPNPVASRSPGLLPPIAVEGADGSGSSGGVHSPTPWKPSAPSARNDSRSNNKSAFSQRNSKSPGYAILDYEMLQCLEENKDQIEAYVIEHLPMDELEKWFVKKLKMQKAKKNFPIFQLNGKKITRYKHKPSKQQSFMNVVKSLQDDPSEQTIFWHLARSISKSIGVDAYRILKCHVNEDSLVQYYVYEHGQYADNSMPLRLIRADPKLAGLVLEIVEHGAIYCISREKDPLRFPDVPRSLFRAFRIQHITRANYAMYLPLLSSGGKISYVIEMWRIRDSFKDTDEETSSTFLVWGSLASHYCNLYLDKKKEKNMNDFLLDVVKAIFEEMVSLDQLIKRILEFAQKLVNADRASLFLVDYRNFELVSTVFDLKFDKGNNRDVEKNEIRMPINRGIAGHVALSGETMNIPDAYSDYRFNRSVDEATGYKTVSILCMPIKVQRKVIGVVQMVNKRSQKKFDSDDEVAFEIFSTFFGLALHHARLYDKILRKEQKYRVALEVLSYHNTCKEDEVQAILRDHNKLQINNLNNYYLDPFMLDELTKCKAAIVMFDELFGLSQFDILTLTRFVLTVKKNYRNVPYHNFDHGWSVGQVMFVILKNDTQKRFTYIMRLALFVACLCHDLDHRGYTNKYMSETASPLAAMYTTSTLEHHHFNITVTILQQDGHNIFSSLSSDHYKEILSVIRQCILATDLAAFFPNLAKIKELHQESTSNFNWSVSSHRELAMAVAMTAADLSASAKPWDVQIKTVKIIFKEFYDQGDKERASGKVPIAMMDRSKPEEQAACQVGFLSQICIPCYEILRKILPNTQPMFLMATKNLNRWQKRADGVSGNHQEINNEDSNDDSNFDDEEETRHREQLKSVEDERSKESTFFDCENVLEEEEKDETVVTVKEDNLNSLSSSPSWDGDETEATELDVTASESGKQDGGIVSDEDD